MSKSNKTVSVAGLLIKNVLYNVILHQHITEVYTHKNFHLILFILTILIHAFTMHAVFFLYLPGTFPLFTYLHMGMRSCIITMNNIIVTYKYLFLQHMTLQWFP